VYGSIPASEEVDVLVVTVRDLYDVGVSTIRKNIFDNAVNL